MSRAKNLAYPAIILTADCLRENQTMEIYLQRQHAQTVDASGELVLL